MFDFLFRMFSFDNEDIDESILKYDAGNTELIIFGKWVYLDPDLVSRAKNIPRRGGAILSSRKTPDGRRTRWPVKFVGEK